MPSSKKVCIFVDGENIRHAIGDLFPSFNKSDYLPRADWTEFFDQIARETTVGFDAERIRTYWYTVENIDFTPFNLNSARKDKVLLIKLLSKSKDIAQTITKIPKEKLDEFIEKTTSGLQNLQSIMEKRFSGWIFIQNEIARKHTAIEFRRAGSIRYNLFTKEFGSEKAVDVKLATDLINLKDIYDVAVIVSGDQDYVPAVDAIKDFGKRTVNIAFQKEDGHLLPGGAKRLNQSTDYSIEMKYLDLKSYFNF